LEVTEPGQCGDSGRGLGRDGAFSAGSNPAGVEAKVWAVVVAPRRWVDCDIGVVRWCCMTLMTVPFSSGAGATAPSPPFNIPLDGLSEVNGGASYLWRLVTRNKGRRGYYPQLLLAIRQHSPWMNSVHCRRCLPSRPSWKMGRRRSYFRRAKLSSPGCEGRRAGLIACYGGSVP
jgi:hypothetical protein